MKRKDLLLLTFLLTQTAPVWAMWSAEDLKAMDNAGKGQPRISAQRKGFKTSLPSEIHKLKPSELLTNFGTAKQIVSCKYGKETSKEIEIELPTEYPLHGQWTSQEDLDHAQTIATLNLCVQFPKERSVAYKHEVKIGHELLSSEKEIPGLNYFNGETVYRARTKLQRWKNPATGKEYDRTLATQDGDVLHHQNHKVIYVEPFALGGDASKPKDKYRGEYKFEHDLAEHEKLPGKRLENLIYSDGTSIYYPHISQELWKKKDSRVGFFIASYRDEQRLNFIPGTTIQGGKLAEGLYQLLSVQDEPKKRIEKWQRLGDDSKAIEITTLAGVPSILGMGGYAPRAVSNDEFLLKTLNLQNKIQDIIKKTEEAKSLYPHAKGSVIILGNTGSGKTTLIHGLAGGLTAKKDHHEMLHLYANEPLPGFNIGHGLGVGTKVPSVWHDAVNDILYWDCPGFEDVRGEEEDILNAFAINRLFNTNVKVVLVADDTDLNAGSTKGQRFLKLLDKMTNLFTNEQQLKENLSLVVTKGTHITPPHTRISILQENVLLKGKEIQLTEKSKNILNFLHTNKSRVNSLPQPSEVGSYTVSDKIITSIHKAKFVPNLHVNFKAGISAKAELLAGKYGQGLDDYLANYMKTEGAQRVINFCNQRIDQHTGPVDSLREEFGKLIGKLESLPTDTKTNFVNGLKTFINVDEITKVLETINFLKTIKDTVTWNIGSWKTALLDNIRGKIEALRAEPTLNFVNNNLNIKGIFFGMGDVKKALDQHPTAQTPA